MSNPNKYTGDDWDFSVTLKQNGAALDVSGATSIKVQVVSSNSYTPVILISAIDASPGNDGADWANGIVTFSFDASNTGSISSTSGWLEIQKEEGGRKTTWPRSVFNILQGTID